MTRSMVELAGFKHFVESQPTKTTKKIFLYALAERWWDTTLTFHIASVEMMITPYNIYRLTGLRVDGLTLTFSAFPTHFQADWEYLGSYLDDKGFSLVPDRYNPGLQHLLDSFSEAPDEIANLWQSSVPHLERLVKDGDFAKYQRYLMPTLCPPYVFMYTVLTVPSLKFKSLDILTSWNILFLENALLATHADINYLIQLYGNMKTMMTNYSLFHFSRPPGSSSRGAQADPDDTDFVDDDDDDEPTFQRG
uniref:Aminotransferase-like plant mobile domain-containing protein n=1 Tax=Fagus sylvatica TaxID=28930 RepID=A0A2N9EG48_FAGSY